jgi:hypothetical protein
MKKIYITLIFCFAISKIVAQNSQTIQVTEEIPNWPLMLTNLNISQITSGVLYDKSAMFSNLITFNSTDNNISGATHFKQTLSELYIASDQTRFISLTELKNRITTGNSVVDVGIINTTFEKLNFNEEDQSAGGLYFQNGDATDTQLLILQPNVGMFTIIPNRPSFISKKIFIASPLQEMVTGSSITFNFKNNLIFNNATTNIKTMVVDFEDGNFATTIVNNGVLAIPAKIVNYTSSGIKTLTFTVTFADNTTIVTYGKVYMNYFANSSRLITSPTCYGILKDKGTFTSKIPFKGYTESSGVFGKSEYTIFYGDNNNARQMIKPIIIVDGFDPKDKRKVQDCDCELDDTPAPNNCKLNNSDIVFNGWGKVPMISINFNAEKHVSLEDLMYYDITPTKRLNLIDELRTKGYDVIIINNPNYTSVNEAGQSVTIDGGADYIERNAMSLVSFIKDYVKTEQKKIGNTAPLVLIGPSMGGQITRYALAHMEKKFEETNDVSWKHNARLWVSVDSPHLGANIPVGAQASIWFLAERLGKEPAKIQFNEELNSVAGKQQIISQFKNALETGYLNGNSFFTTYYNNLNSNGVAGSGGYPVTTPSFRKIAMVNGSLTGVKDASEQQTFLYTRGYIRGVWPFQSSTITLMRLQDNFMPASGQSGIVFRGDGQTSGFSLHLFGGCNPCFNHPRYALSVNNNSIVGSLDVIPGGYFRTAKYIREAVESGLSEAGVRSETRDYIENHSFIPAFSALGHLYPYQNWGNPLNTNLACPSNKQTPFDSYYGTAKNTEHTSFTKESADWLFKELDGIPQPPSFPMQDNQLTGLDIICLNTNTNYQFADICKIPSAVTWSVSPNIQIVSSTGYNLTVKGLTSGTGTLTATFQNGQTVSKTIWVGKPSVNLEYYYFDPQPVKSTLCAVSSDPNLTLTQQGVTSVTYTGLTNYNLTCIRTTLPECIEVTVTNACGTTTVTYECGFKMANANTNYYTIYPNPSNDLVNIDLRDQKNQPKNNKTISGELFDMMGQSKSKVEISNNKATFSVKGLNKGIYVLKIYINNQVESHQIAVK